MVLRGVMDLRFVPPRLFQASRRKAGAIVPAGTGRRYSLRATVKRARPIKEDVPCLFVPAIS
jgi:hypothetical protein